MQIDQRDNKRAGTYVYIKFIPFDSKMSTTDFLIQIRIFSKFEYLIIWTLLFEHSIIQTAYIYVHMEAYTYAHNLVYI